MTVQHAAEVCQRKLRHRTWRSAFDERDRLLAEYGIWTQVFRCPVCNGLHLGTPYSQQFRARERRVRA